MIALLETAAAGATELLTGTCDAAATTADAAPEAAAEAEVDMATLLDVLFFKKKVSIQ